MSNCRPLPPRKCLALQHQVDGKLELQIEKTTHRRFMVDGNNERNIYLMFVLCSMCVIVVICLVLVLVPVVVAV